MQARDGTPACRLHAVAAQAEVINVVSVPSDQRNAEGKGGGSQRSWWPWRHHEDCGPGLVDVRTVEGAEAVGAVEVTAPWSVTLQNLEKCCDRPLKPPCRPLVSFRLPLTCKSFEAFAFDPHLSPRSLTSVDS